MQKYETKGGKAYMFRLRCIFIRHSECNEEFAHEIDFRFVQNDSIISIKKSKTRPLGRFRGASGLSDTLPVSYGVCISPYFIGVSTVMTTVLL